MMAIEVGLHQIARKKESMGICFVGKREFQDFISEVKETPFSPFNVDCFDKIKQDYGNNYFVTVAVYKR